MLNQSGTVFFQLEEVARMLAQSLGLEKAREIVNSTAKALGFHAPQLSRHDTESLLAKIAEEPGLIGLSATLAKSRLHFKKAASTLDAVRSA